MHAHLREPEQGPAYLAAGVTSVRDVGNAPSFAEALALSTFLVACRVRGCHDTAS